MLQTLPQIPPVTIPHFDAFANFYIVESSSSSNNARNRRLGGRLGHGSFHTAMALATMFVTAQAGDPDVVTVLEQSIA